MTEVEKELLVTILASEVAGIAANPVTNQDLYDEVYNFLFKSYISADEHTLQSIQNNIID